MAAFKLFRETREALPEDQAISFDRIRAAYEDYALTTSKAGDAGRKSHQNHMNLADQVLVWLTAEHPRLDLDADDVQVWLDSLRHQYSEWTVHHMLTKLRLLLDQAMRLRMIQGNPARLVKIAAPRTQDGT
jgi:hypothetical protein